MGWHYYGAWGGPGWSDNQFTLSDENINWRGRVVDALDGAFREHDHNYFRAITAYALSAQTGDDRRNYWQRITEADKRLRRDLYALNADGILGRPGDPLYVVAARADVAFALKELVWNRPSYQAYRDPDKSLGRLVMEHAATGSPLVRLALGGGLWQQSATGVAALLKSFAHAIGVRARVLRLLLLTSDISPRSQPLALRTRIALGQSMVATNHKRCRCVPSSVATPTANGYAASSRWSVLGLSKQYANGMNSSSSQSAHQADVARLVQASADMHGRILDSRRSEFGPLASAAQQLAPNRQASGPFVSDPAFALIA